MYLDELLREYFPKENDHFNEDFLGFVLWNCTGWPSFWNIPEDGDTLEECLRTQLRKDRERFDNNQCLSCGADDGRRNNNWCLNTPIGTQMCWDCGFIAKSAVGLKLHEKIHN